MRAAIITLVASAAIVGGCESSGQPSAHTSAPPHGIVTSNASAPPSAAVPYADAALPDEADFAAEAERDITPDNYRDELAALERTLADAGSPPPPTAASALP